MYAILKMLHIKYCIENHDSCCPVQATREVSSCGFCLYFGIIQSGYFCSACLSPQSVVYFHILIPVALAKSVSLYYPKIKAKSTTGNFTGCLYWATAIMAFLCNILHAAFSMWHTFRNKPAITSCIIQHKCSVPSDANVYKDELLTLLFVYIIIASTVFAELLVSVLAVKFNFHDLRSLRDGRRPSWKQFLRWNIHVLALWNILIAIQLLTMIAIPICVLLFLHPQVTILCVIVLFMVPASLTLIVAYLLYQCQQPRMRKVCWNAKKMWTHFHAVNCGSCNSGTNYCTRYII